LVSAQAQTYDSRARAAGDQLAPDVQNNPMIQAQEALLAQSQVKLQSIGEKFGTNHPQYQQALAERDANQQQLNALSKQYVGSLKQGANNSAARQAGLQGAFSSEKSTLLAQKEQAVQLDALRKEVEDAQRAYSQVLQRFSDTSLASHVSQTDIFVLKSAVEPDKPSWPRPFLTLLVSLVFGGLLAAGSAMMAEMLDRRVHVPEDVEVLLGLPVLALVEYAEIRELSRFDLLKFRLKTLVGRRAA
jgi:uncharacterized protein involved in exopolysaccharide biosynthesis